MSALHARGNLGGGRGRGGQRAGRAQHAQHARRDVHVRAGRAGAAVAAQECLARARVRAQLDVQVAALRVAAQALPRRAMRRSSTWHTPSSCGRVTDVWGLALRPDACLRATHVCTDQGCCRGRLLSLRKPGPLRKLTVGAHVSVRDRPGAGRPCMCPAEFQTWPLDRPHHRGARLQEKGADGHQLRARAVLQRAARDRAAARQPARAHRHTRGVVHVRAAALGAPLAAPGPARQRSRDARTLFQRSPQRSRAAQHAALISGSHVQYTMPTIHVRQAREARSRVSPTAAAAARQASRAARHAAPRGARRQNTGQCITGSW